MNSFIMILEFYQMFCRTAILSSSKCPKHDGNLALQSGPPYGLSKIGICLVPAISEGSKSEKNAVKNTRAPFKDFYH